MLAKREQIQQQLDAFVVIEKCTHTLHDYALKMLHQQQLYQQRQHFFAGQASQTVEQELKQAAVQAQNALEKSHQQYRDTVQQQQHTQQTATTIQQLNNVISD